MNVTYCLREKTEGREIVMYMFIFMLSGHGEQAHLHGYDDGDC